MSRWMGFQWILLLLAAPAAGYFLRARKQGRIQTAYCIILIFGYLWALGQHLENSIYLYWPEENTYRASLYLCYLGMCVLGPACVYLSWCYGGKYRPFRDKGKTASLFGTGAFFYLVILTNDLHHLYYTRFSLAGRDYGLLFYPFTLFSYGCFVYAYLTMQRVKWDAEDRSTWLLLLCFGPPVAANTWGMFVLNPALDFTPAAYCIMVIGAYLIVWYHRPLCLTPIAAKNVLDNMAHPVGVEDFTGRTLYHNGVAGQPERAYRTTRSGLEDGNTLVMRTDVTWYQKFQMELEAQNASLEAARRELAEQTDALERQARTAAELAAQQEHMKIMSLLDTEVRGILEQLRDNTEEAVSLPEPERLERGRKLSSQALEIVRRIVREIRGGIEHGL